ncbi:MAG: hypothetical protein HKN93_04810, partial [Acidimicrobiia bacterium]|nr:hypothetical protein [Acidimicrobiia bacterium]
MRSVLDLDRVAADDAQVGGKARNLAKLRAAGLPCPAGVVVPAAALATGNWRSELEDACARLRAPLAVRSSASIEDLSSGAAPGLFASILEVAPDAVAEAVEAVATSARGVAVRSYCLLRNIDPEAVAMSVVIQEQVTDVLATGVLYTRPPSRPDAPTLVVDIEHSDDGPWAGERARDGSGAPVPLPPAAWQQLVDHALAAERAIGAEQGADVEWVIDRSNQVWLAQARPIVHGEEMRPAPIELFQFSHGDDREWSWDVTHNPDPLSPAQAGLVDRVGAIGAGFEMRVVGGYLYTAPSATPAPGAELPDSAGAITRFFTDEIVPAVDAQLAAFERGSEPPLGAALSAYDQVVGLYGRRVAPTLRAGRQPLQQFLAAHSPEANLSQSMT